MCAEVVAVGRFRADLVDSLEYAPEYYESTRDGAPVVRVLFGIAEGSSLSRTFAALLGVAEAWDFNQHALDVANFDREGLRAFGARHRDYHADVEALLVFADAGFDLYFLPNG